MKYQRLSLLFILVMIIMSLCIVDGILVNYSFVGPIIYGVTQATPGSQAVDAGKDASSTLLNISTSNGNLLNLKGITNLDIYQAQLDFAHNANNFYGWSANANILYLGNVIGTGTINYNFIANSSPATATYEISLNNIVWNNNVNNIVLPSGTQIGIIQLSYLLPSQSSGAISDVSGGAIAIPAYAPTAAGGLMYLSYNAGATVSVFRISTGSNPNCRYTMTYNTQFVNYLNGTFNNGVVTFNVIKTNITGSQTGLSYVNITDSTNVLYPTSLGKSDISGTSFAPPVIFTITDLTVPTTYIQSLFYPTFNLSIYPITGNSLSTYNTLLQISTGVMPSDINFVTYTYYGNNGAFSGSLYDTNTTKKNVMSYGKKGGIWYQWDGTGYNIALSSLPLNSPFSLQTPGNYTISVLMQSNILGALTYTSNQFSVSSSASNIVYVNFQINDVRSGGTISNGGLGIYDINNAHWTNYTLATGSVLLPVYANYWYIYQGSANNYNPSSAITISFVSNQTVPINLIPSSLNISTGNTTLSVTVEDGQTYQNLAGATVSVSSSTNSYSSTLVTSASGVAFFTVPNNTIYTVNTLLSGYSSASTVVSVGSNTALVLQYLNPLNVKPTNVITVPTTISAPSIGLANSSPNSSGANGNGQCVTNPAGGLLGVIYNFFACEGISTQAGEYIACAFAMALLGLYVGGRYGGGLGAVIGAATAYTFDLLIGWLPLWTLIAFLCICAVIMSAKIFLSSE